MSTEGYRTPSKAELVTVIRTEAIRGRGIDGDAVRVVYQYWNVYGQLLAEWDTAGGDRPNPYAGTRAQDAF